jgi:type IV pilus biogenesis protein PilP
VKKRKRSDEHMSPGLETGYDAVALPVEPPERRSRPMVVIVAAAVFLIVAAASAAAVYVFVLGAPEGDSSPVAPAPVEQAPVATQSAEEAVEPAPVPLKRVFTFRDIFDPLIEPIPAPTGNSGTTTTSTVTGSTTTTATASADTLTLQNVVSVDGEPAAVLLLNGQTYTLKAGESIAGTPWKVLSIDGQTVVMLYGDARVTLSVGQGVTPSTK